MTDFQKSLSLLKATSKYNPLYLYRLDNAIKEEDAANPTSDNVAILQDLKHTFVNQNISISPIQLFNSYVTMEKPDLYEFDLEAYLTVKDKLQKLYTALELCNKSAEDLISTTLAEAEKLIKNYKEDFWDVEDHLTFLMMLCKKYRCLEYSEETLNTFMGIKKYALQVEIAWKDQLKQGDLHAFSNELPYDQLKLFLIMGMKMYLAGDSIDEIYSGFKGNLVSMDLKDEEKESLDAEFLKRLLEFPEYPSLEDVLSKISFDNRVLGYVPQEVAIQLKKEISDLVFPYYFEEQKEFLLSYIVASFIKNKDKIWFKNTLDLLLKFNEISSIEYKKLCSVGEDVIT